MGVLSKIGRFFRPILDNIVQKWTFLSLKCPKNVQKWAFFRPILDNVQKWTFSFFTKIQKFTKKSKISKNAKKWICDHYALIFIFHRKFTVTFFFDFFFKKSIGKSHFGHDFLCPFFKIPMYFSIFFVIEEKNIKYTI